jgi:myo-inositol-1-phosphate synthase
LTVRVAIAGVGNCASVLLQGIEFYKIGRREGLWHKRVGGLAVKDIRIVAAFDIDSRKVGTDIADAANEEPNVARKVLEIPPMGVRVEAGLVEGEVPPHLRNERIVKSDARNVVKTLGESNADILLNLISSGSNRASIAYANACLKASCSYANCTPTLVLKERSIVSRFRDAKLAIVGDDLMSQFGGTIFHRGVLKMMVDRGVKVLKSYQLDVGGGAETFNTIDEEIKMVKRRLKTESVVSEVPYKFETIAGTTDYVDYMNNDRTSYFWIEGRGFMNSPITFDVYLRSSDGANAGNILLDVIRSVCASARSGRYGAIEEICAYAFKSPPSKMHFDEAYSRFQEKFVY